MNHRRVLMVTVLAFGLLVLSTCSDSDTVTGPTSDPTLVTDLAAGLSDYNSIALTWTAPSGALEYDIRYATDSLTSGNWDSATQVQSAPLPLAAGEREMFRVEGLIIGHFKRSDDCLDLKFAKERERVAREEPDKLKDLPRFKCRLCGIGLRCHALLNNDPSICSGCGACSQFPCPVDALSFEGLSFSFRTNITELKDLGERHG